MGLELGAGLTQRKVGLRFSSPHSVWGTKIGLYAAGEDECGIVLASNQGGLLVPTGRLV